MIKIAVLDDEQMMREQIAAIIERYVHETGEWLQVKCYESSEELKWDLEDKKEYYDIFLLDIELGSTNGLEVAHFVRQHAPDPFIVFITSYVQYSVKGYEYNVYRYILKNELEELLPTALESMCEIIKNMHEKCYIIETASSIEKIKCKDIYYLYISGKYTYFCMEQGESRVRKPLGEVFAELDLPEFVYLDKSHVVNLKHVVSVKKMNVRIRNGEELTVSKTQVKQLIEHIKDYMGRAM